MVPEFWMKEVELARVKLPEVVAFAVIVQPPAAELRVRFAKGELPGLIVLPVVVAVIFIVPELWVKVAELSKFPPTAKTPVGAVRVPAWTVKLLVVVASAVVKLHAPFVPLKMRL